VDIYVDESGDLGFSWPRSSKYLIVAMLATSDSRQLHRIMKRARSRFRDSRYPGGEFKFNRESDVVRVFFMEALGKADCAITWTAVDKTKPRRRFTRGSDLYDLACEETLRQMSRVLEAGSIDMIMDCRRSKIRQRRNLEFLMNRVLMSNHPGHFPPELTIRHLDSESCVGLQIHDFVVGSVFQSVERMNERYLRIIEGRVTSCRVI